MAAKSPKVTIAVPLYRSNRFLPILIETLRCLEYDDLEVIVSDRHHEDDAIEQLQGIFGADPRFRFIGADDKMDWVGHYNLLLREATGEYFVWVSHDDSYSANYFAELARGLDENPDAVAAYGRVQRITLDGRPMASPQAPPNQGRTPNALRAYRITLSGMHVFHGMFRRRMLVDRQLWIRRTVENIAADALWTFAVATTAPVHFVGSCTFIKRYYPSSTHKLWGPIIRPRYVWEFARVTNSYLDDYAPGRMQRLFGKVVVALACGLWAVRLSGRALARKQK